MSIPRQVLAQAAEADAQLQGMRDKANPPAPEAANPPPEPAKPPAPPVVEDWKARHDVAAHRLSVTEGITRKQGEEIQALHAQVKQLKAELEAAKATPPPPPKPAPDLAKFDPELLEVVDHTVEQRVAPTRQELEQLRAERDARKAAEEKAADEQRRKNEFVDFMDEFVPGWRKIDSDPEFAAYLALPDPTSGEQAQAAYMDAFHRIDGRAMARVFNRYLATKASAPAATPPAPPVVPPVSGRVDVVDAPAGKVWSQSEIDEFYSSYTKGRLRAPAWTPKRIADTEADILAAYREGRVR